MHDGRSNPLTCFGTLALALVLMGAPAASARGASLPPLTGPIVDAAGVLPPETRNEVRFALDRFRQASDRWLVVVVLPAGSTAGLSLADGAEGPSWADAPVGIVYATTPDDPDGKLLVVDPDWQRVAPDWWAAMFPRRLGEKYGDEPFARRVALSAAYLAEVFPDKIAFLLQPPDRIGEDSIAFAENVMTVVKWFVYFIILFTFFRTIFPARLRDEDTDEVSQELRRLKKERQIW